MKKIILIVAALTLLLGASSLVAANTNWQGKYWGDFEGIWKGTLYDDPTGPDKPYFEGKWSSADMNKAGKLFASLYYEGHGIYKIVKGTIYDVDGSEIGSWDGYFDVNFKPGRAEGEWKTFADPDGDAPHYGKWQGQRILFEEE